MKNKVEIIAQNVRDAINAQKGGAKRIELVSSLSEGGLTPSIGMIEEVLKNISIETAIMIRPCSDTFCYDKHYLYVMKNDIKNISLLGAKRVVLGILDKNADIDFEAMDYVLGDTDMKVTFHRAIDSSNNLIDSIKRLNEYKKVDHILTSGGSNKATDNIDTLQKMINISRAKIMVGSGLTGDSIAFLKANLTGEYDIHFGSFVQDDNKIVSVEKVKNIVDSFYRN